MTEAMAAHISCIVLAKVTSRAGSQDNYLPLQCELRHDSQKLVLSFTHDDGSGDIERRVFIISDHKVEMKHRGNSPMISVLTRSGVDIGLQFTNKEAQSLWFKALTSSSSSPAMPSNISPLVPTSLSMLIGCYLT